MGGLIPRKKKGKGKKSRAEEEKKKLEPTVDVSFCLDGLVVVLVGFPP